MQCPNCQHIKLKTYDTRQVSAFVVRKRNCLACDHRFYTIESYMTEDELENIELLRREENDTRSKSEGRSKEATG